MRRLRLAPCLLLVAAACSKAPSTSQAALSFFRALPEAIAPGASSQLSWSAVGVETCTLSPELGAVLATGSVLVTPAQSTSYAIDCGGASQVLEVTVLPQVTITAFTATPLQVAADGTIELAWDSKAADLCKISPLVGRVAPSGTVSVPMTDTTTFTLSCTGFGGPATASVTATVVAVTSLAPPTQPALAPGDGFLTASWVQPIGGADVYLAEAPGLTKAGTASLDGGVVLRRVQSPLVLGGLVNGKTYFLRVAAVSGTLESELSGEVSGVPTPTASLGDPFYAEQWHLKNTGQLGGTAGQDINVEPTWPSGRGELVRVAIVDDGVDLGHEDLRQNVALGRSWDYLGNARLAWAEHGTCVAGLVAARDGNGVGVRGAAPRATLVSYNVLQDLSAANEYDAMIRGKDVNGVSSNSWGDANDGTGQITYAAPTWLAGVTEGTSLGRGGKGTVYLWAAGNGADWDTPDMASYDGQASSYYVNAIGAVGDDGVVSSYSEVGPCVLVVAPSEGSSGQALTTTDLTGALGFNDGRTGGEHQNANYSKTMNGTSGSTPIAAGVAALVLQANPDLTWRDVRRVLALSARKTDPTDAEWTLNGAGLHVNPKYGFGVVDARAAVELAKAFVWGAAEVTFTTALSSPALAVPDNDGTGVSSSVTVAGSGIAKLDFVELVLTVTHQRSGDLDILLSRPGGATDVFQVQHPCELNAAGSEACTRIVAYPFGSVRHLDETADTTWTVTLKDRAAGVTGALASYKLILHGRP